MSNEFIIYLLAVISFLNTFAIIVFFRTFVVKRDSKRAKWSPLRKW